MILEVKKFPESQEVMDNPEWFLIMDADPNDNKLGHSSYARILDENSYEFLSGRRNDLEVILNEVIGEGFLTDNDPGDEHESTKPDDCMITYQDPGDENES